MASNVEALRQMIENIIDAKLAALNNTLVGSINNLALDNKMLDTKLDSILNAVTNQKKTIRTKAEKPADGAAGTADGSSADSVTAPGGAPTRTKKTAVNYFKDMWVDSTEKGADFRAQFDVPEFLKKVVEDPQIKKRKEGEQRNKAIGDRVLAYIKGSDKAKYDEYMKLYEQYKATFNAPKNTAQAQVEAESP